MYQIVLKPFGKKKKMTKKNLLDFVETFYDVPKDKVQEIEVKETEKMYIYTYTIRG
jgi:hypothetical protein